MKTSLLGRISAVVLVAAALAVPHPALAHDGLKRSVPAKDAVLTAVPAALRLTFSNGPNLRFTRIQLLDSASVAVALGELRIDSVSTVVADIKGALRPGRYTVVWQIAGADGHPVRGRFAFTVAPNATGADDPHAGGRTGGEAAADVATPGANAPPDVHHTAPAAGESAFDAESPLYVLVRWVTFLALLIVVGAVAFHAVVLRLFARRADELTASDFASASRARLAKVGAAAAAVLLLAGAARLFAQSVAMHGAGDSTNPALVGALIGQTAWGWGWLLQIAAAIVAFLAFRALARGSGWAAPVLIIAGLLLASTPALSGHALSAPRWKPLAVAADAFHVVGAGSWLGSLLMVLVVGLPVAWGLGEARRGRAVADLVNAFSPTALLFAGLAGATGLFSAWLHIERLGNVWGSTYGRVLLVKLAILSVVAATGAYNWLRVRPSLGGPDGAARIRRSSTIEVAIGAVVLLVTAILVATPTPMDMSGMSH